MTEINAIQNDILYTGTVEFEKLSTHSANTNTKTQAAATEQNEDENSYVYVNIEDEDNKQTNISINYDNALDFRNTDEYKKTLNANVNILETKSTVTPLNASDIDISDLNKINYLLIETSINIGMAKINVSNYEQAVKKYEKEIDNLKKELEEKQNEKDNLRQQLNSAASQEDADSIIQKMNNLNTRCIQICYEINTTMSLLETVQQNYAQAKADLDTLNSNYETLQDAQIRAQEYQQQKIAEELKALFSQNNTDSTNNNNDFNSNQNSSTNPVSEIVDKVIETGGKIGNAILNYNSNKAEKIAEAAKIAGGALGTVGWCFKGVCETLKASKLWNGATPTSGAAAYMAADQLASRNDFKEVTKEVTDLKKLPAGAIVVWGQHSGEYGEYGHISVALGNGKEASDHIRNQITSLYDSKFRVFLPV